MVADYYFCQILCQYATGKSSLFPALICAKKNHYQSLQKLNLGNEVVRFGNTVCIYSRANKLICCCIELIAIE